MYVRINIFNCINASKNDCKLVPSVPGFALQVKCKANAESNLFAMLSRSLYSPLQLACDGKGRNIILEEGVFIGALGLIGTNWD